MKTQLSDAQILKHIKELRKAIDENKDAVKRYEDENSKLKHMRQEITESNIKINKIYDKLGISSW